ncbi:MAG: FAD-binding protein [Myxococcota bacterium]|nr:FAD-binding protein [Myxococcota bacterium]
MAEYEVIEVAGAAETGWDAEADVVVVGLGAAGGCAALEARAAGADVLVLERASGGGGLTASAAGHLYLGGGTRVQRACGFDDTVEDMIGYLLAVTPDPDEAKIRAYCQDSVAHFDWLVAQGVPFTDAMAPGKLVLQMTDETLCWSGNEEVYPYREKARAFPRGHKVAREGEAGGAGLMEAVIARADAAGVRIEADAAVVALLREGGRIAGVRYREFDGERSVRARQAVVLATGHFTWNEEMLRRYCPRLADPRIERQGGTHDDGAGIQLGLAAGGVAVHMDGALLTSPFYPPESLVKGILVNNRGRRYVAEDSYHSRSTIFSLDQPDGEVYLIADDACYEPPVMGQELIDAWDSIEAMAKDLHLPELPDTVARYNENAARGEDPDFHKHPKWLKPLDAAPFAAVQCSLGKAWYTGFTLGGLRVSIDGEVLDAAGAAIPGLYAAGACASNIAQDGAGYSSGTCIGEATYFGRRAGRHAAAH